MIKNALVLALFVALALAATNQTEAAACTLGTATGCSTSVCSGLTAQLVQELNAMGYTFTNIGSSSYSSYIHCTSPCEPYLQAAAATSLKSAAQSKGDYITLNSAYRSSAQQYLLYQWYLTGKCNIGLAAVPGTSDHEAGRSIDTSYYSYWMSTLTSKGWTWSYGNSDPYHFDYFASPDISTQSLKAFQNLWNIHNPNDKITADGVYGPATASALSRSPCNGW